ncbi:MAG: DUF5591 domain-containing protein [Candidatus Diapherotrites archaeon]|nr:DUF5591 domain-containing protein [Candidatus Diapherotrites archaeon]
MTTKTLVLASGQCSWRGCIFCGYSKTEPAPVNMARQCADLDRLFVEGGFDELKIFCSGSFLDDRQFTPEFRRRLARKCMDKHVPLTVESRPEFVTAEALGDFEGVEFTVAIGLETSDPALLRKLNKGFTPDDFARAADLLHSKGFRVRTYLLVNPPFCTDVSGSIHDSVAFARKYSDSIVVINTLPHGKTPLLDMWLAGEWSPLTKKEFFDVVADMDGVEKDAETFRFIPTFPREYRRVIRGATEENLTHPHYVVWQDWLQRFYEPPKWARVALFLPCSAKKPYSKSKTHSLVWSVVKRFRGVHRIVVSNPGVIPIEFDDHYPFNAYEWDEREETPEIRKRYVEMNAERVKKYLQAHAYERVLCFLKYSETYEAVKRACDELGIPLRNALSKETYERFKDEGNPLFREEALEELGNALREILG